MPLFWETLQTTLVLAGGYQRCLLRLLSVAAFFAREHD